MSSTRISPGSVVRWSQDHLSAEVSDEIVLMSIMRGAYFGLDGIASDIWRRLATSVRVETLCESLLGNYRAEPAALRRDVERFLGQLAEEGLITVTAPETPGGG